MIGSCGVTSKLKFFHVQPQGNVVTIVDGLKRLYAEKLKPLEVTYRFNDFASPVLVSELISVLSFCFI